jgi:hypothetical protein
MLHPIVPPFSRFPAGTAAKPGLQIAASNTGIAQLAPNSLSIVTPYQGVDASENHGPVTITHRGSVLIGSRSSSGDNRLPNQSGLEICYLNTAVAAPVSMTIAEWGPDSQATEPVIFYRSRGGSIGASGAALAGDSIGVYQAQVDDGFGTANVACANLYMRVDPDGTAPTPAPGNTRSYPGYFGFATAPGDGTTKITTRVEINSTGRMRVVTGSQGLQLGASSLTCYRVAIVDDAAYSFSTVNNVHAMIFMYASVTASSSAPQGFFFARPDGSSGAPVAGQIVGSTNVAFTTGVLTGTTGTDGKLTISVSGGTVYVENRLGSKRTYSFLVFNGGG